MNGDDFALAVGQRASSVLSRTPARTAEFAIGLFAFTLTAPAGADETWMGRAFHQSANAGSAPAHAVFAWDGVTAGNLPPPRPWDMYGPEPLGVVASHSNDAV